MEWDALFGCVSWECVVVCECIVDDMASTAETFWVADMTRQYEKTAKESGSIVSYDILPILPKSCQGILTAYNR